MRAKNGQPGECSSIVERAGVRIAECCLCHAADHRVLFTVAEYQIVRCRRCRLVYLNPQPSADRLPEIYQESYWASRSASDCGYTDYLGDEELYRRTFRRRLKHHVLPFARRGRLLDVGCAAGFFVDEAARAGFEAAGVDVSRPMVDYARQALKLEQVTRGTLEERRFADGTYDVVTMWDVIEHVPDPPTLLKEARRVLSDDGCLVLETQNVHSAFARLTGRRWHHYKVPEHLFHFAPESCTRLLNQAGFEVVRWTSRHAGKHIPLSFIVERSARISPFLPRLLAPLGALRNASLYVNLFDEMVFVARPAASGGCSRDLVPGLNVAPASAEAVPPGSESRRKAAA